MIVVKKMEPGQKERVIRFINQAMREEYHCDAHVLPEVVFVACQQIRTGEDELVGVIGLSLGKNGSLPLERFYEADQAFSAPVGSRGPSGAAVSTREIFSRRTEAAQFGRWVAEVPRAAEMLVHAAAGYARENGCMWGIGEAKPAVARHFALMGIKVVRIPGRIVFRNIPPNVLPYYTTPPLPGIYVFSLLQPYFSSIR
ncbi:MAG TPA: hypothetical protein VHZ04_01975 [Candidatus Paceibacterota bacterium]|nr:hypothetical protein [Candidatus Paceibacterota bacterium]